MTKKQRSILDKWLEFVYDEGENFFFLCDHHKGMVMRKQDGVLLTKMAKVMPCDYPKCKKLSEWEYFPNIFPSYWTPRVKS